MEYTNEEHELVQLYHIAQTALASRWPVSRHDRMSWAAREFARTRGIKEVQAYKQLSRLIPPQ